MLSKIKNKYKTATVAFGGSGFSLGMRDDIDDLAIIAHESGNRLLLNLFETLPELDVLKKTKTDNQLKQIRDGVNETTSAELKERTSEEQKPEEQSQSSDVEE